MNDRDFIIAAANLARRAPEEWSKFAETYGDYVEDKIVECVQSQLDMLPVAQGRAQALIKLGQIFNDCIRKAEEIAIAQANKAPPTAKRP